jgi:hypothetical protein
MGEGGHALAGPGEGFVRTGFGGTVQLRPTSHPEVRRLLTWRTRIATICAHYEAGLAWAGQLI